MFTGIVTAIGRITQTDPLGEGQGYGMRLTLSTPEGFLDDVALGDSIALNGACMTVTSLDACTNRFTIDISAESLNKTHGLEGEGRVNLEKAMRPTDRLGGHMVSGHVDGVGHLMALEPLGESHRMRIAAPLSMARYLAYKGSVTVNGVSLTVNEVIDTPEHCEIRINLIPHTLSHTTLGDLQPGVGVNLEIDLMARYVERMMSLQSEQR